MNKKINLKLSFKQQFLAGYNVSAGKVIITEEDIMTKIPTSKEVIPVVHNNQVVWSINSRFACSGRAGFRNVIYVDDFYFQLPEIVRKFIIQHEIGHIEKGHNEEIKKPVLNSFSRAFHLSELEKEADRYALEVLGYERTYEALSYLINNVEMQNVTLKELQLRLDYIKRTSF